MQGRMPGVRRRGRPRTAWVDNINTWTGLPVEESVSKKEDRDRVVCIMLSAIFTMQLTQSFGM